MVNPLKDYLRADYARIKYEFLIAVAATPLVKAMKNQLAIVISSNFSIDFAVITTLNSARSESGDVSG